MNTILINHFYKIGDVIMKCIKLRKSGCNTFQIVDEHGNDIIKHDTNHNGVVTDHGQRIVFKRTNELSEVKLIVNHLN